MDLATARKVIADQDSGATIWDDNARAAANDVIRGGGGGSGNRSVDLASYDKLLENIPKAQDMVGDINTTENNAFAEYLKYVSGQPTPLESFLKISEAQGVPKLRETQKTLQGQIYDLEDTLRRVEPNVKATTRNSIVTEAQRQGMVESRQRPLVEQLGWQSQSLARISSALAEANAQALQLTGLESEGINRMISVYKDKINLASRQGDRQLQAFLNDMNVQLDISLAKIHRGEQISDQEAANAFAQLQAQIDFENQVKLQEKFPTQEIVEMGGRKYLVNKRTGEKIDLGLSTFGNGVNNNFIKTPEPTPKPKPLIITNKPGGAMGPVKPPQDDFTPQPLDPYSQKLLDQYNINKAIEGIDLTKWQK